MGAIEMLLLLEKYETCNRDLNRENINSKWSKSTMYMRREETRQSGSCRHINVWFFLQSATNTTEEAFSVRYIEARLDFIIRIIPNDFNLLPTQTTPSLSCIRLWPSRCTHARARQRTHTAPTLKLTEAIQEH